MQKYQDVVDIIGPPGLMPITGAQVTVYLRGTSTQAAIYSDNSSTVAGNPLTTDSSGRYSFYAADGRYDLKVSGAGIQTTTLTDVVLSDVVPALAASSGSSLVGFIQSGTGAVARTAQAQLRDYWITVNQFGQTVGDGVANDANLIQLAINAANVAGGGTVYFPRPSVSYNLGTTSLTTYPNVRLIGAAQPYTSSTRGVVLVYSGAGSAILGTNMLNGDIENISIDATNSTGASVRGIYLTGAWLCTLRNVRVKGVTPAKGFSILIDTNAGAWGGQHNYFERIEAPDGIIRLSGTSGNDEVTTTVFNTVRGNQYQINNSQIVAINSSVGNQPWTGFGWDFQGASDGLLLHCDIELGGAGDVGINIGGTSIVRELGTTWGGFTGTTRISGNTTAFDMWGGGWIFKDIPAAGNLFNSVVNWSSFAQFLVRANNVTGGNQDGNFEVKRFVGGAQINQFEWRNQFKIETSKSIANVATTVLTIPTTSNTGFRIKVSARGIQSAAGMFDVVQEAVVVNDFGAIVITAGAALTAKNVGAAPVLTFTSSGTNILVQFNHGSATPSPVSFIIEIDGDVTGYTKN